MSVTQMFQAAAEFMVADRPDLYTTESALEDLIRFHDHLTQYDGPGWTSFAGYMLFKHVEGEGEDEVIEWHLTRKLASAIVFPKERVTQVYGHTALSGTLNREINLPDVSGPQP